MGKKTCMLSLSKNMRVRRRAPIWWRNTWGKTQSTSVWLSLISTSISKLAERWRRPSRLWTALFPKCKCSRKWLREMLLRSKKKLESEEPALCSIPTAGRWQRSSAQTWTWAPSTKCHKHPLTNSKPSKTKFRLQLMLSKEKLTFESSK